MYTILDLPLRICTIFTRSLLEKRQTESTTPDLNIVFCINAKDLPVLSEGILLWGEKKKRKKSKQFILLHLNTLTAVVIRMSLPETTLYMVVPGKLILVTDNLEKH